MPRETTPPRGERVSPITEDGSAGIFSGHSFWLSLKVPARQYYKEKIEKLGGNVVKTEKHADYMLVDDLKEAYDPDKISYKFIDKCEKDKRLVDEAPFKMSDKKGGKKTAAPAPAAAAAKETSGTVWKSGRRGRVPFTPEEDQALLDHIDANPGAFLGGNKFYEDFCAIYPSAHTPQSWRSRYLEHLVGRKGQPRLKAPQIAKGAIAAQEKKPEPNKSRQVVRQRESSRSASPEPTRSLKEDVGPNFSKGDLKLLKKLGKAVTAAGNNEKADRLIKKHAKYYSHHSKEDWEFGLTKVLEKWANGEAEESDSSESSSDSESGSEPEVKRIEGSKVNEEEGEEERDELPPLQKDESRSIVKEDRGKERYTTPRHQKSSPPKKAPRSPQGHPIADPSSDAGQPPVRHSPGLTPPKQMAQRLKKPPRSPQGHPVIQEEESVERGSKKTSEKDEPNGEDAFKMYMARKKEKFQKGMQPGKADTKRSRKRSAEPEAAPEPRPSRKRRLQKEALEIRATPEPELVPIPEKDDVEMQTQAIYDQVETYRPSDDDFPDFDDDNPLRADVIEDQGLFVKKTSKKYGVKREVVEAAIYKTSAVKELAERIVKDFSEHKGFPELPGVWSEEDDKLAQATDARTLEMLAEKHTTDSLELRLQFLASMRGKPHITLTY